MSSQDNNWWEVLSRKAQSLYPFWPIIFARFVISVVLMFLVFSQNARLANYLGGVDQIVNHKGYLIGKYLAWLGFFLPIFVVVMSHFNRRMLPKRLLKIACFANIFTYFLLTAISAYYWNPDRLDMMVRDFPFVRVALNSLILGATIALLTRLNTAGGDDGHRY